MPYADNVAKRLFDEGRAHGWWPPTTMALTFEQFRDSDPIGYNEFLDTVHHILYGD